MKHLINGTVLEQADCNIIPYLDTSVYITGIEPTIPLLKIFPTVNLYQLNVLLVIYYQATKIK